MPSSTRCSNSRAGALGLYRLEQVAVEDRLMLSGVNLAPVHYLAEVEPVLEEVRHRADAEAMVFADPPWNIPIAGHVSGQVCSLSPTRWLSGKSQSHRINDVGGESGPPPIATGLAHRSKPTMVQQR